MARTYCITCDGEIVMDKPRMGQKFECPECGDALEVVSVEPFDVDYPYDDEWDDDEWDDDEDWEDEEDY